PLGRASLDVKLRLRRGLSAPAAVLRAFVVGVDAARGPFWSRGRFGGYHGCSRGRHRKNPRDAFDDGVLCGKRRQVRHGFVPHRPVRGLFRHQDVARLRRGARGQRRRRAGVDPVVATRRGPRVDSAAHRGVFRFARGAADDARWRERRPVAAPGGGFSTARGRRERQAALGVGPPVGRSVSVRPGGARRRAQVHQGPGARIRRKTPRIGPAALRRAGGALHDAISPLRIATPTTRRDVTLPCESRGLEGARRAAPRPFFAASLPCRRLLPSATCATR
ncbi:hypothetical protein M885DRAFT_616548, partial [Pelagophyceae sp. CCMP2097]